MDKTQALQHLLDGTASEEEISLLKQGLVSGEISIGGNVNHSVIIIGSGNTVELTPEALDRLNARPLLGDLDRDLTGKEITLGLDRLQSELPLRAPVLLIPFQEQTRCLRPSLKTSSTSLSESSRKERVEALAVINSLCMETLDISFNALCLGEEPPEYDARSPFRGLESFRPEDSEFFFGREALTRKLVGKINAHSFLAVLGASGSGKSSLVMAGLIPALGLDYLIFRPGTDPLGALESAKEKALIVVDQFEELFTLTRDEATRKEFIAKLLEASQKIVITLRSDFLGEVASYRDLNQEVQAHLENVPPMDMDELRRAMEGQAGVVGLRFEADLSQQILDDVEGEPGAMPLLQHALWELWNRRHGRWLRASEYRAFGGVKQAITSTAEKAYGECTKAEQEQMRDIFLRLTRLDDSDEGRDTRRRVPLSDLIPSGRDTALITLLLDKLANARLVVKTVNEDKTEIEVAHEALIRHWERLRVWLNEDRDNLRLREGVSEDARRWENAGRDEALLNHRGGRLDDALSLGDNSRYGLTEIEQTYLNACVSLRNREQRERERRLRLIVIASIAAAVIFLVLGSFGWLKSNEATAQAIKAEEQAKIAIARQLAAQAQPLFASGNSKQETAVLLAIQSMRMFPTGESAQVLQNNSLAHPISRMTYIGLVESVAFSPDGRYVVSGGCDQQGTPCTQGSARVWESGTGKEIARMTHDGSIASVAFSPDSKYVVSSGGTTVRVWEATTGKDIARITYNSWAGFSAFNFNGKQIVSAGCDQKYPSGSCVKGSVRVWDATNGKEIARMNHDDIVYSVGISPDGKYIVSGGCDQKDSNNSCAQGSARVWDATNGREIARMTHDGPVNSVAFSPDSKYVVSGSDDKTARVWEVATGKEIARMTHNDWVRYVIFSPDGKYVISADITIVCLWEIATGKEIARMTHEGPVYSVAFSPDGKYVVSGGCDQWDSYQSCTQGSARVWEASTGKEITRITHGSYVYSVAFSPDGKYVVSGGDITARVWEAIARNDIVHITYGSYANSIFFSPNGKYVISGGCEQLGSNGWCTQSSARIWETSTGREITRTIYDGPVYAVAFSPNGKYAVSDGCNQQNADGYCTQGSAHVREVGTGKEIAFMINNELSVNSIAFSSDSMDVILSGYKTVRIWRADTGKEIIHIKNYSIVSIAAFSPDGKYMVMGNDYFDNTIHVKNINTGEEIAHMTHDDPVNFVAFSPDGKYVVSGSEDKTARVWEANTGKEIARMTYNDSVSSAAFSPDSKYVITGGCDRLDLSCVQSSARVWEATTGKEISRMTYDGNVRSVAFSPDGKYVVAGGCDQLDSNQFCAQGSARVWEATTGKEIIRMTQDNSEPFAAFSPDGKYVLSGGETTIHVWLWNPNDLIAEACSRIIRNLSRSEWTQYIGDALPYQAVCPNLPIEAESTPTP